ncbi:unnamed protein product [Caenorhabditis brenneri]
MRRFLLLFLLSIFESLSFPAKNESFEVSRIDISDPDDRGVLPNIDTYFCINSELRSVVATALSNFSNSGTSAVDQLQAAIETALMPKFQSSGGTWLVSATSYHRVKGFVDDRATGMDTFCAVNNNMLNIYVVVMKIDN